MYLVYHKILEVEYFSVERAEQNLGVTDDFYLEYHSSPTAWLFDLDLWPLMPLPVSQLGRHPGFEGQCSPSLTQTTTRWLYILSY